MIICKRQKHFSRPMKKIKGPGAKGCSRQKFDSPQCEYQTFCTADLIIVNTKSNEGP
jgi:hypothetical protein